MWNCDLLLLGRLERSSPLVQESLQRLKSVCQCFRSDLDHLFAITCSSHAVMAADEDKFVLFVSGLRIGGQSTNPLELQLLLDHLTGHLGEEQVLGSAYIP